jgi:electron transport complex protein RnfE
LALAAYFYDLWRNLGLFVPLIVVNCIILGRAEAFASRNSIGRSVLDGVGMSLGFTATLFVLGTIREIIGSGTLTLFQLGDTEVKFAVLGANYPGILVMILPPGAFLTLGIMLACRNAIQARLDKR